jgi:hypothetical protein
MAQQQLHLAQSQIPPANLPTAAILKTMHLAAASHTTHQIRDWKQKGKNTKKTLKYIKIAAQKPFDFCKAYITLD